MSYLLTTNADCRCPHGGKLLLIPTGTKPKICGGEIVTPMDLQRAVIVGCVNPPPAGGPCLKVSSAIDPLVLTLKTSGLPIASQVVIALTEKGLPITVVSPGNMIVKYRFSPSPPQPSDENPAEEPKPKKPSKIKKWLEKAPQKLAEAAGKKLGKEIAKQLTSDNKKEQDQDEDECAQEDEQSAEEKKDEKPAQDQKKDEKKIDSKGLEVGDIILSTTDALISKAIRSFTDSKISHAILYIGNDEVVEAIRGGVCKRSLSQALSEATLAIALRHPKMNPLTANKIKEYALKQVGNAYGYVTIANQGIFQIIAPGTNINQMSLADKIKAWLAFGPISIDSSYICSELAIEAYKIAGLSLVSVPSHWVSPNNILQLEAAGKLKFIKQIVPPIPESIN